MTLTLRRDRNQIGPPHFFLGRKMKVDVVFLPSALKPDHMNGKAVAVFDVLRATTSMTAAVSNGIREIRVFGDLESAAAAGAACPDPHLICGERHAVKPPGFDLGNSPEAFLSERVGGKVLLMSTTNGTRAIIAAKSAPTVFVAALVNAGAAADALISTGLDVTLLCSGTEGEVSLEDILGAGAVIEALGNQGAEVQLISDSAQVADFTFQSRRGDLADALLGSRGGRNVVRAGLTKDIAFCARLDSLSVVGVVSPDALVVRKWERP
jgi:2-phosphosulfolactate phosphatase